MLLPRKMNTLPKADSCICLKFYHIFAIFTTYFRQHFPLPACDTPYRFLTFYKWYWLIVWKYKSVPADWFFPLPYVSHNMPVPPNFSVYPLRIPAPSGLQGNKWLPAIICCLTVLIQIQSVSVISIFLRKPSNYWIIKSRTQIILLGNRIKHLTVIAETVLYFFRLLYDVSKSIIAIVV